MSSSAVRTTAGARGLLIELVFTAALVLISEVVVRLSQWHRLSVLVVVFVTGNVLRAIVGLWRRSRTGRPREEATVVERSR
jgi:hypothetical protein